MEILEIILAFAILMITFSTITAGLTEMLLRLFCRRAAILRKVLEKFANDIDNAVKPNNSGNSEDLADHLTVNAAAPFWKKFLKIWNYLPELDRDEMLERLATSSRGQTIANMGKDMIDHLVLKYDMYIANASKTYSQQARNFAILVSIGFAILLQIQVSRLVEFLQVDHMMRAEIIESLDMVELIETVAQSSEDSPASPKGDGGQGAASGDSPTSHEGDGGQGAASGDSPTSHEGDGGQGAASKDSKNGDIKDTSKDALEAVEKALEEVLEVGAKFNLPIGGPGGWRDSFNSFGTFFDVLAAGLLIGLGAPFWYRVVVQVTRVRSLLGSATALAGVGRSSQSEAATTAKGKEDELTDALATAKIRFEASLKP